MNINEMNPIQLYEQAYLSKDQFVEALMGCGQMTIAEEGLDRFCFYIEVAAERKDLDYYIEKFANHLN